MNNLLSLVLLMFGLKERFSEVEMQERNFETSLPKRSDWEGNQSPEEANITIYTDGSKMDDGVGEGVYFEEKDSYQFQKTIKCL